MKKFLCFTLSIVLLFSLSACNLANEGKTDNLEVLDKAPAIDKNLAEDISSEFLYRFVSADGTVEFSIELNDVNTIELYNKLPIAHVTPHSITPDETKHIASLLFGDSQIFEYDHFRTMTKDEIKMKLKLWEEYCSKENLSRLYGENPELISQMQEIVQQFIDNYRKLYNTAPDTLTFEECQWTFYPSEHYTAKYSEGQPDNNYRGNYSIRAQTEVNNIPYTFRVTNRHEDDYLIHNVYVHIDDTLPSPNNLETRIIQANLTRTEAPSAESMSDVYKKATQIINELGFGKWYIDQYYYVEQPISYDISEYVIFVNAVPMIDGTPISRIPQIENLKSTNKYSSNYYYSDMCFRFSVDGTLLDFQLISPIDIEGEITYDELITFDEIIDKLDTNLSLTNTKMYDYFGDDSIKTYTNVRISNIELGLSRINVQDSLYDYYVIPSIVVYGNYYTYSARTDELLFDSSDLYGEEQVIVVLNATDGSTINMPTQPDT